MRAIRLDLNNDEALDEYDKLVGKSGLSELYFAGDIKGLREVTNSYFFRIIECRDEYYDIYYCDKLSMYFFRGDNLSILGSRRETYAIDENRLKCTMFLNKCKEINELDKEITANRQLLLLKKGKIFTK